MYLSNKVHFYRGLFFNWMFLLISVCVVAGLPQANRHKLFDGLSTEQGFYTSKDFSSSRHEKPVKPGEQSVTKSHLMIFKFPEAPHIRSPESNFFQLDLLKILC